MIKVNITKVGQVKLCPTWQNVNMKSIVSRLDISDKKKETESNYEEHSAQLVCNLQNWKCHENSGKTEELWQLNDLQNLGLDPFVIEDIAGTTSNI